MILQANFHYEIDEKERITSTTGKNGNDLFLSLQKLQNDIQYKFIYLDNTFQKVFAISTVELIRLPEKEGELEDFIDLIFHISCQKGIKVIGFHLRKQKISNQVIAIENSEKIQQLLDEFKNNNNPQIQDQPEKPQYCFVLDNNYYQSKNTTLNAILQVQPDKEEQEQIFSLIIQEPNSTCFIGSKNQVIRVLSNFQINQAQLYETNLGWSGEKSEPKKPEPTKPEPRLFLDASEINSIPMKNSYTYQTTIKLNYHKQSECHLMFVFNRKVLAFQFPLKFRKSK